MSQVPLG